MAWSGGSFTRTNGTNTGSTLWNQDRIDGTKITAARHDTHDQDLADGINNCLTKDGQNAATSDIDLNGNSLVLDADADTSIGATSDDRVDITIGGSVLERIGHDSTNSSAFHLIAPAAYTAQANTNIAHLNIAPSAAVTVPAGTTAVVASLEINEPNITATGTVTNAASLYISGAPTEGGTGNFAFWVDDGAVKFDSTLDVDGVVSIASDLVHIGDTDNKIAFTTDAQSFETGGSSRLDISDSGVRLGGANARVTTVLDEDTMSSDSATALATQQSIKAYVDAAGSGGWEFVSSSTASASATVSFTGFESGYDYMVTLDKIIPATDAVQLQYVLGISGPTYRTSGYSTCFGGVLSTGSAVAHEATTAFFLCDNGQPQGNATDEFLHGHIIILDPEGSGKTASFGVVGHRTNTPNFVNGTNSGQYNTAEAHDAIQFSYSSGNIASGVFKLYRRPNA